MFNAVSICLFFFLGAAPIKDLTRFIFQCCPPALNQCFLNQSFLNQSFLIGSLFSAAPVCPLRSGVWRSCASTALLCSFTVLPAGESTRVSSTKYMYTVPRVPQRLSPR